MVNAQEWLDQNYPKEKRGEITWLLINGKKLEGHLDLSDFVNLKRLDCSDNKLTSLGLIDNVNLTQVIAYSNKPLKSNLYIFSRLTKLKKLDLGLSYYKESDFCGSLVYLRDCKNLEYLCIGFNDRITEGLEYVPTEKLTHFGCHGTVFEEMLKPYGLGHKGLIAWKAAKFAERIKKETNLEELTKIKQELGEIVNLTEEKNNLTKQLQNIKGTVSTLETNNANLRKQKEAIIQQRDQKITELKEKENLLNSEKAKFEKEKSELVKTKNNEINTLTKNLETLEAKKEREKKEAVIEAKKENQAEIEKQKGKLLKKLGRDIFEKRTLEQLIDQIITDYTKEQIHHDYKKPTRGKQFRDFVGYTWAADKVGTGLAITGFVTIIPSLLTALGYCLKLVISYKTGGASTVAEKLIKSNSKHIEQAEEEEEIFDIQPPQETKTRTEKITG